MLEIPRITKTVHIIMFMLLFGAMLLANVAYSDYSVGVKNGDWIRYDINFSYTGQNSQLTSYMGSIQINIQQVQGNTITGTYEVKAEGIVVIPSVEFSLDVSTGSGSYASGFIVPANLTAGQSIPGESANVQNIVDWNGRKAILANTTSPYGGFGGQVYWDQQTGVLLESKGSAIGTTYSIKAADTSLWSGGLFGGSFPILIIAIVAAVIVVAIVAVFVLRRRRTLPAPPVSPQMDQPPPPPPPLP